MKKHFYTYLILVTLCFSPFPIQASTCSPGLFKQKRQLKLEEVAEQFITPKEMQTLDMSLLSPEDVITLLRENRSWRAAIIPDQIRQIDVSVEGIQHVFAPTFKDFIWAPEISIDALSDEQVMRLDRDTFLRDVFLAGDLYVSGHLPPDVTEFMIQRKRTVKELGDDTVMSGSLPKVTHDFIVRRLGFDKDFESMTPDERRELFKKEIAMMTDTSQQIDIIEKLVEVAVVAEIAHKKLNE